MRAIARFLTVVTVLVLLAGGYVIWAAELKVSSAGAVLESAADRAEAFGNIYESMRVGASELEVFTTESIDPSPEQYMFVTYTLKVRNLNALPAEWMQLSLEPQDGDVLMVKPTVEDVPAFNEQLVTLVLLTSRNAADYVRNARLNYYVYGHEYSVPVTLTP